MLEKRLVDEVVEPDQVLPKALELAEREGGKIGSGVWGQMKVRSTRESSIQRRWILQSV